MIRKAFATFLLVFLGALLIAPGASAEDVAADTVVQSAGEKIELTVPEDLPSGFHQATVQVIDASNVAADKIIEFCKDNAGVIHWDNMCPDLLEGITDRDALPAYDSSKDANRVGGIAVAAFAATAAISSTKPESSSAPQQEQDSLEGIEAGTLEKIEKESGFGDRSFTWKFPFTRLMDSTFVAIPHAINPISPLVARVAADGNYHRAIFGSLSFLLYPLGIYLGLRSLSDGSGQAMPAAFATVAAALLLGIADSFAGFLAAITFAVGVALHGNMGSRDEFLTIVGISAVYFAPVLIASSFRPLRRNVKDFASFWERISDYLLATLLTAWVVKKMVGALSGLSGVQLAIGGKADELAIIAGAAIVLRLLAEDLASSAYPGRTNALTPELHHPAPLQHFFSNVLKVVMFIVLAEPFIGVSKELWFGAALFALPIFIGMLEGAFPKTTKFFRLLPAGTPQIIIMIVIGSASAKLLQHFIPDPALYLKAAFYLLAIPGLVLTFIGFFSQSPEGHDNWKSHRLGKYVYRIGGIAIYVLLAQQVLN